MLHRCPRSLADSASSAIRLLMPWATPVSIITSGWRWRAAHQIALHGSMSASLYQPVGMAARAQPARGQQCADVSQQVLGPLRFRTRPGGADQVVQVRVPVVVE